MTVYCSNGNFSMMNATLLEFSALNSFSLKRCKHWSERHFVNPIHIDLLRLWFKPPARSVLICSDICLPDVYAHQVLFLFAFAFTFWKEVLWPQGSGCKENNSKTDSVQIFRKWLMCKGTQIQQELTLIFFREKWLLWTQCNLWYVTL